MARALLEPRLVESLVRESLLTSLRQLCSCHSDALTARGGACPSTSRVIYGAFSAYRFPAGMSCTWDVKQAVQKHYNFF